MTAAPGPSSISFDPRLVEETVLLAERSFDPATRGSFRRQRDRFYDLPDPDERERRFASFHAEWFVRLELGIAIGQRLAEHPIFSGRPAPVSRCAVILANAARDEGADLHEERGPGNPSGRPALVIRLRPSTLLDPGRCTPLLRRDLLHVADMLDPSFRYAPSPPAVEGGATREKLVRDRYRVLWDLSVDGRLVSRGLLDNGVEQARKAEYLAAFGMPGPEAEGPFERLFRGPRPAHPELWAMACAAGGAGLCPLCRFPTPVLHPAAALLPQTLITAIRQEFPQWQPETGLCGHCADLYASRPGRHTGSSTVSCPNQTAH